MTWPLTDTEVHEMAHSLLDAEATLEDAVRYGAERARWHIADMMLRDGGPNDVGPDFGYWIPLSLWHQILNWED